MHIITQRRIADAAREHPECAGALDHWYRIARRAQVLNFSQLRHLFPGVDKVGDLFVFNIGGNKLRLIAAIHFNRQKLFVRAVLTHAEYDQGGWQS
ncbi:type II toxin-antitoxin system HigB family toxin [uncultured Thiodictyon sp.]|jgi:mRNA interferase HigB|uniref:type II toxin-antitoxin system HigB family toxin n=1 Tax=uncultured Thiodictyon sp. TaxID=1846217 RepID=UPI0025FCFBD1|nr:type II toxin-antitoxin system HigB family toxin [uncultured Thiodictyon sp.]